MIARPSISFPIVWIVRCWIIELFTDESFPLMINVSDIAAAVAYLQLPISPNSVCIPKYFLIMRMQNVFAFEIFRVMAMKEKLKS